MKTWILALVFLCVAAVAAAQEMVMPGPPKEKMDALSFLLGEFDTDETVYMPDGTALPMKGTVSGKMALGGQYLEATYLGNMPGLGEMQGRLFIGYDPDKEHYTGIWMDSAWGVPMILSGTVEDGKLVMESEPYEMMGESSTYRMTYTKVADGIETLIETKTSGNWQRMMAGKYVKD